MRSYRLQAARWLIVGMFVVTLLVACATPTSNPPPSPSSTESKPDMPDIWNVRLGISGGIAGIQKDLELVSTGQLIVIDQKKNRRVEGIVPAEELESISELVRVVVHIQPLGQPPACPDCFQYQLDVQMDEQHVSFQVNDLNLVESGLDPLISALTALQERALSGQLQSTAPIIEPEASFFPCSLAASVHRVLRKYLNQNSVIFEPFDSGKFIDLCKKR